MQHMIRVGLHPTVARDPCAPVCLDLLRQWPKVLLQYHHALFRLLRPKNGRDARDPRGDMEDIHTWARPPMNGPTVIAAGGVSIAKALMQKSVDAAKYPTCLRGSRGR
jgi:hypothetical protein